MTPAGNTMRSRSPCTSYAVAPSSAIMRSCSKRMTASGQAILVIARPCDTESPPSSPASYSPLNRLHPLEPPKRKRPVGVALLPPPAGRLHHHVQIHRDCDFEHFTRPDPGLPRLTPRAGRQVKHHADGLSPLQGQVHPLKRVVAGFGKNLPALGALIALAIAALSDFRQSIRQLWHVTLT